MRALVDALYRTQNPFSCPHGRPTIIHMTMQELEKKFGRIA
jgi:DNA mismatch repair protein MutL